MRRLIMNVAFFCLLSLILLACKPEPPNEQMGKMKISGICRGEKIFFKKNGRFATFEELVKANLADSDFSRGWGYKSEIKITERGFFASVIPNDFTKAGMFYTDEKGIIHKHSGDINVVTSDQVCELDSACNCSGD